MLCWYWNYLTIFQVIQQQQLLKTNRSSVLFNPETQTKIIYRVVYPPGSKSAQKPQQLPDGAVAENSTSWGMPKKVRKHRRTRSGRVCRPPQYMVKDYKEVHAVEYEAETNNVIGPGYSESKDSSEDEANTGDDHVPSKRLDLEEPIPTGE